MAKGRDDSALYTGASSASFATPKEKEIKSKRLEEQQKRHDKRLQIHPAADIIKEELNKEIHTLIYSPYPEEDKMSDAQFRAERRARRLAIKSLLGVQTRMKIILRAPAKPQEEVSWGDDE